MAPKHTAYISPVYTFSIFTPDSLCISNIPILFTWLDSELGHGHPGPTPQHTSPHSCPCPPKHTHMHTPSISDGIHLPKMAISLCPL